MSVRISATEGTSILRVLHIITGLQTGGAEVMLGRLLGAMDPVRFEQGVISLTTVGPVGEQIAAAGFFLKAIELRRRAPNPLRLLSLAREVRAFRPDVIQTWMHDADLLGGIAGRLVSGTPVIWGIHQGRFDSTDASQRRILLVARACAALSRTVPWRILCCSQTSRESHGELGYDQARMVVIENGFDLEKFRPRPDARDDFRAELGLDKSAIVAGAIGRFHPQKDHRTLIAAIDLLGRRLEPINRTGVHFVVCGDGLSDDSRELNRWIDEAGVRDRVHLLGRRNDVPRISAALDFLVSSSSSEAFPLVIGEAMASGVPCVATDVGDSSILIGDTGIVVRARDPEALANGLARMLDRGPEGRRQLGCAARKRIEDHYSLSSVAGRYAALYEEAARTRHHGSERDHG